MQKFKQGLELFGLQIRNTAAGFLGIFTHSNTADRTYTLPDKSGTVAMTSDIVSGGTVSSLSVTSANGFSGTVANSTTTPAITIGTTVAAGMVKSTGTGLTGATAGTDYVNPITLAGVSGASGVGDSIYSGVSLTQHQINSMDITFESFGADPTGVNDSTPAFNSAIAYVVTIGAGLIGSNNSTGQGARIRVGTPGAIFKISGTVIVVSGLKIDLSGARLNGGGYLTTSNTCFQSGYVLNGAVVSNDLNSVSFTASTINNSNIITVVGTVTGQGISVGGVVYGTGIPYQASILTFGTSGTTGTGGAGTYALSANAQTTGSGTCTQGMQSYVVGLEIRNGFFSNFGRALSMAGCIDGCIFEGCISYNCLYHIYAYNSFYSLWCNHTARGSAGGATNGVFHFDSWVNVQEIESVFSVGRYQAFEFFNYVDGLSLRNCGCEGPGTNGMLFGGEVDLLEIRNCYFENLTGNALNFSAAYPHKNVTIDNNWFNNVATLFNGVQMGSGSTWGRGNQVNPSNTWVTGTIYSVSQMVFANGSNWVCTTMHTAGTFATDLAAGKWTTGASVYLGDDIYNYMDVTIPDAIAQDVNHTMFSGTISGNLLTVGTFFVGTTITVNGTLSGPGIAAGVTITGFNSGTGGVGTVATLSASPGNLSGVQMGCAPLPVANPSFTFSATGGQYAKVNVHGRMVINSNSNGLALVVAEGAAFTYNPKPFCYFGVSGYIPNQVAFCTEYYSGTGTATILVIDTRIVYDPYVMGVFALKIIAVGVNTYALCGKFYGLAVAVDINGGSFTVAASNNTGSIRFTISGATGFTAATSGAAAEGIIRLV